MSSGCGDVLSLEDLQTAKKHQIFEAEVITGKAGGVAGGADIDFASNPVTGHTQKTLPAVLRDSGFTPASFDFTTGGTLTTNDRNKVVFDSATSAWYSWAGALPKVVPAGTNPLLDSNWKPQTDPNLRTELAAADGAKLSLSQVATAYGLNFSLGGVWAAGATSTVDNWWWYDNKVYTGGSGTLPATPALPWYEVTGEDYISLASFFPVASSTSVDNSPNFTAAIAVAIAQGKRLFVPAGTYYVKAPVDLTVGTVHMFGDGLEKTFILAGTGFVGESVINMYHSADSIRRSTSVSHLTADANNIANYAIRIQYVHYAKTHNCRFINGVVSNFYSINDWLSTYDCCFFTPAPTRGAHLAGANNRVLFSACGFGGGVDGGYIFYADGNSEGLTLLGCDLEFGVGKGYYFNVHVATVQGGYIGEQVKGDIITVNDGTVTVSGCQLFYGYYNTGTRLTVVNNDAMLSVDGCYIADQGYGTLDKIAASTDARANVVFRETYIGATISGAQVMTGNCLGRLPMRTYAETRPILYTMSNTGNTVTRTRYNSIGSKVVINTITDSSANKVSLNVTLKDRGWKVNDRVYLVVTYESTVDVPVYLSGTVYAASAATLFGTLPSTGGALMTCYVAANLIPENTSNIFEFYLNGGAVGSYFAIQDVTLTDRSYTYRGTSMFMLAKAE